MTYTNPIIPGFHPDPSICRVGENYFLVTSSFEYFPGVPLFHSRDLVHWRQIGHVLTRPSQLSFADWRPSGGIFAPTIRYHDGIFYMITTNMSGGGNFYLHTRDPYGEWSEPIWVDQSGIDPSLHFDDDGRVYLTSNWIGRFPPPDEIDPTDPVWGIQQSEIDITTGKRLTEPQRIWAGTGGRFPEAPHLYKINGRYYLMIAEGGTELCHMVTIARSDTPWGPWESCPHNPILTHRSQQSPFQAIGHADLIEASDGSWWLVCLGIRPPSMPYCAHLGRETFLAPVRWDDAGWPVVGQQGRLRVEMDSPAFGPVTWERAPERDDFNAPHLSVHWNFLGVPDAAAWSLTDRPGALRLRGTAARLDDGPPVAFVGRRQEHYACEVATRIDFEPTTKCEEAGLTVWMNPSHHYDLFVTRRDNQRQLIVRRRIGSLVAEVARRPIERGPLTLTIHAEPHSYAFGCLGDNGEGQILATGETRYLAPEVAGGFAGVYFALYASGGGEAAAASAFFEWFDYRGTAKDSS
jgi:alpha-N-arabinofuranosidase